LENSHNLSIDLNLNLNKKKYWEPNIGLKNNMSSDEASEGVNFYLLNSLRIRMRSDVPIAFCLSGGVDSGLLASHAKKSLNKDISTFSIIDDDERYNEKDNIEIICKDLKSDTNFINLKKENKIFLDRLNQLTKYHDGPIATLSYYIHSFLSEGISKNNFKVSISGTGADELFTGYFEHFLLHLQTLSNSEFFEENLKDWEKFIKPNIRNEFLKDPLIYIKNPKYRDNIYEKNFNLIKYSIFSNNNEFKENHYTDELLRNRMLNELFHEVVPVILKT
jgi:Asparagine synthase (glutamine-hydrolyzing)